MLGTRAKLDFRLTETMSYLATATGISGSGISIRQEFSRNSKRTREVRAFHANGIPSSLALSPHADGMVSSSSLLKKFKFSKRAASIFRCLTSAAVVFFIFVIFYLLIL